MVIAVHNTVYNFTGEMSVSHAEWDAFWGGSCDRSADHTSGTWTGVQLHTHNVYVVVEHP